MPCVRARMYEVKTEKLFVVLCTSFLYKAHRWQRVTFYDPFDPSVNGPVSDPRTYESRPITYELWVYCLSSAHLRLWHQHRVGYKILTLVYFSYLFAVTFGENRWRTVSVRVRTDRETDRRTHAGTETNWIYNMSHAIYYSYGADPAKQDSYNQ